MAEIQIDRRFVRLAEGEILLREAGAEGDAARPPLYMLHASPASGWSLEGAQRACASHGRHVIVPDTPGNGDSAPLGQTQPDMADYAEAMDRLAEAQGHVQIDLYGTHTGAHIAIEWAIRAPERVQCLVLDGVAVLDDAQRAEFLAEYAPPQRADATGAQFHWAWHYIRDQMIFFPHYRRDAAHLRQGGTFAPETLHRLTLEVLKSLETYHHAYHAVFRHDVIARLPMVRQPVLIISTRGEPLGPSLPALSAALPAARMAEIPHEGRTQALAAAIEDFLKEQE